MARDRGDRGPLEGYPNKYVGRLPVGALDKRGRFDTIGSTVYFADSEKRADAEALFGFRQELMRLTPLALLAGYKSPPSTPRRSSVMPNRTGSTTRGPSAATGSSSALSTSHRCPHAAGGFRWTTPRHS